MAEVGRPTKYKEEFCKQAEMLCKKGFINMEIADFFNVNIDTIYEWQKQHQNFSDALKSGKRYCDDAIVQSLYDRAKDREVVETKEETGTNGSKTTITTRQVPGDTTAMIFWLKNRQPDKWRAQPTPDVEDDTPDKLNINISVVDASKDA